MTTVMVTVMNGTKNIFMVAGIQLLTQCSTLEPNQTMSRIGITELV